MITAQADAPTLVEDEQVSVSTSHETGLVSDVKEYLTIGVSGDNSMIHGLVRASIEHIADRASHYVNQQTRRVAFAEYAERYRIPAEPVSSLDAVETLNEGSATSETLSDWYLHPTSPPEIRLTDGGTTLQSDYQMIRFEYAAGYASLSDVPQKVKTVIKKMVADLYEYRASKEEPLENSLEETPMQWDDLLTGIETPYYSQPKSAQDSFFL